MLLCWGLAQDHMVQWAFYRQGLYTSPNLMPRAQELFCCLDQLQLSQGQTEHEYQTLKVNRFEYDWILPVKQSCHCSAVFAIARIISHQPHQYFFKVWCHHHQDVQQSGKPLQCKEWRLVGRGAVSLTESHELLGHHGSFEADLSLWGASEGMGPSRK